MVKLETKVSYLDKKTLCNYCFVAECQDINPENLKNTKCTGLSKEDSEKGLACDYFSKLITGGDTTDWTSNGNVRRW